MKKIILSAFTIALMASCGSNQINATASNTQQSFKVFGNCSMCEKTIEGAFKDLSGVTKADWDKETKQIVVEFDTAVIQLADIKQKIANVGYDMEDVRAEESTYINLPNCCQYDRPGTDVNMDMNNDSHDMEHHNH